MYCVIREPSSLKGSFSSRLENVDRFCDQVRVLHQELGRDDVSFAIELLLREMLNNAILHGNKANPELVVTCIFAITEGSVVIEVADEGAGFDWKQNVAALAKKMSNFADGEMIQESGYGLFLLKEYASTYSYNDKGNVVSFTINLSQ